ncbi:glycosyltransferase family 2 protein [Phenylobacterium immobile]|uniref:glycosyltransferase family 2 protein n=1 Tax=Phenylobacterium immobile TaxID=21 RepID=UPI000A4799E2|nr:glycosyltransferase family 2 protein [Phenylobacterium immobile]
MPDAQPRSIAAPTSLRDAAVWLVIPCYRVRAQILKVIARTPTWVAGIVCVDDACPQDTGALVQAECADPRVVVLKNPENLGVGGATLAGYAEAARRGGRILVKVDGDDQMDLDYLAALVAPIILGEADYAKGNRFTSTSHLSGMPRVRLFGNAALSFMAKLSTGYWSVFDPTNGFTAIDAEVAHLLQNRRIERRYFFETDLLYQLGTLRAVVRDVAMPARYADEESNLKIGAAVLPFAAKHLRNFGKRVIGQYFVRDFNAASLQFVFGIAAIAFGLIYGLSYLATREVGTAAPAGVVMMAALPIILGVQLLLQSLNFDVLSQPSRPIHPYLRAVADLGRGEKALTS